jgi:tRNA-Thr(GGU) m(6)t(6)A37 methyltransferase TsaA
MQYQNQEVFKVYSIGRVHRSDDEIALEIDAPFRPALKDLEQFSHVMVFWWADQFDNDEDRTQLFIKPPYAPDRAMGVFATRSPFRPNPIAMTTCPLVDVDMEQGRIVVTGIDAVDETPIIDLKAYFPICDRVRDARMPVWLAGWPAWMPEAGTRLQEQYKKQ